MKQIIKLSLLSLLLISQYGQAQEANLNIDAKQIPGKWLCEASYPAFGGTSKVVSKTSFSPGGTLTQDDTITQTSATGETSIIKVTGAGHWSYSVEKRIMSQTLDKVNVAYDATNVSDSLIGSQYQKAYQAAVGAPAQQSYVIRLTDKEWISTLGNTPETTLGIECTR